MNDRTPPLNHRPLAPSSPFSPPVDGVGDKKCMKKDDFVEEDNACVSQTKTMPFDICTPKQVGVTILKPSLLKQNREKKKQLSQCRKSIELLRPGMVLLKGYISISEQVKIVKVCRELGLGVGGFYRPFYENGAMLNLKMMCLGRNWDPQTSQYGYKRPFDGSCPPHIPDDFLTLVNSAIEDSRSVTKPPHIPSISPDICIVNFYNENGRLGLHQDKDESKQSLHEGLPVVSFSIGDTAEFLYGDASDVAKAKKVLLESGDVLIFGGKSRNVFHGVSAITRDTAPSILIEETNLRKPGRLNLTFRQY